MSYKEEDASLNTASCILLFLKKHAHIDCIDIDCDKHNNGVYRAPFLNPFDNI